MKLEINDNKLSITNTRDIKAEFNSGLGFKIKAQIRMTWTLKKKGTKEKERLKTMNQT